MQRNSIGLCAMAAAFSLSSAAFAQSRPSTVNMPCSQAHATVKSTGAVVLGTGGYSYDRFVANERFCTFQEIAVPAWVRARDTAQCFIGYVCESVAGRDPSPH